MPLPYDPFARGVLPVGVRTAQLIDRQRANRRLPMEVWYPADAQHAGQDLDTNTQDTFTVLPDAPPVQQAAVRDAAVLPGRYPLILFSHTSNGHRRQSTFLCTHLASHGYIVAGVDHTGNTVVEAAERAAAGKTFTPEERDAYIEKIIADRVPDVRFLLDELLAPLGAAGDVSHQVNEDRIGMIGWSFGGWTVLATQETDARCGALIALAPGGSSKPLPGIIPAQLTFAWQHDVPTLYLVAEQDQFTPLAGQYELFERTPSSKQMFVLRNTDHGHFADHIDDQTGCSAEDAQAFTRALALAHMDAVLKNNPDAQHFLANDADQALRDRGIAALQCEAAVDTPAQPRLRR